MASSFQLLFKCLTSLIEGVSAGAQSAETEKEVVGEVADDMMRVGRSTVEVAMYIRGLGVQVSVEVAFFEGDEDIKEWCILIVGSYRELDGWMEVVEVLGEL